MMIKNISLQKNNSKNKIKTYHIVKGGEEMSNCTNTCNPCYTTCTTNQNGFGGCGRYAFILVLFILLVICGAAFWF